MKNIYSLIFCFLVACSATTPSPSAGPPASSEPTLKKEANNSEKLFRLLQKVDDKKSWQSVKGFDLQCSEASCQYYTLPSSEKTAKKVVITGKAAADLFALFLKLPVAKGESGVGTAYFSCQKYSLSAGSDFQCELAQSVQ